MYADVDIQTTSKTLHFNVHFHAWMYLQSITQSIDFMETLDKDIPKGKLTMIGKDQQIYKSHLNLYHCRLLESCLRQWWYFDHFAQSSVARSGCLHCTVYTQLWILLLWHWREKPRPSFHALNSVCTYIDR